MNQFSQNGSLGKTPPDTGKTPPDTGKTPPDTGKTPPDTGRDPVTGWVAQGSFGTGSTRVAGVVVRGFVEAYGPLGDTELTVSVKWPAGSVGPMPGGPGGSANTTSAPAIKTSPYPGPQTLLARRPPELPRETVKSGEVDQASARVSAKKAAKKAAKRVPAKKAAKKSPSA